MLDLAFIRQNPDIVRQTIANRHEKAPVDEIITLDSKRRRILTELEGLRRSRKEIARDRLVAAEEGRRIRDRVRELETSLKTTEARLKDLLLRIPNTPDSSVPLGKDDTENLVVREWGEPCKLDFHPAPHWEIGEKLGIIDFERGVKLSGTRFYILKGLGARLQRAIIAFMLDVHTRDHGYTEVYSPFMVKRECMQGAGQLPKFAENRLMYLHHGDILLFGYALAVVVFRENLDHFVADLPQLHADLPVFGLHVDHLPREFPPAGFVDPHSHRGSLCQYARAHVLKLRRVC